MKRRDLERHLSAHGARKVAGLGEAERVLADRSSFPLDEEHWNEFVDLLERPVRDNPGLVRLFSKPTVFE